MQVAEGLHFLHAQANQIHRGISPEAICVTAAGAWKLAGFGFAVLSDFGSSNPADMSFDYSDSSASLTAQALKVLSCACNLAPTALKCYALRPLHYQLLALYPYLPLGSLYIHTCS